MLDRNDPFGRAMGLRQVMDRLLEDAFVMPRGGESQGWGALTWRGRGPEHSGQHRRVDRAPYHGSEGVFSRPRRPRWPSDVASAI